MTTEAKVPSLASLDFLPFLTETGQLPEPVQDKIGVYAIFDANQTLEYVGYSRNIALSLKQHLVRQPQKCHWLKYQTIERPNRNILEEIKAAWIAENGSVPPGNNQDETKWTQPIDTKPQMTQSEKETYEKSEDLGKIKLLKNVARRVESEILEVLKERGVQLEIRFQPKLKEQGLLDLK